MSQEEVSEKLEGSEKPEKSEEQEELEDVLHLGNTIGIHSTMYGYTKGRVIYRDLELIRVMPDEASDRAVEFPMAPDGRRFAPEIGVTVVDIFEKQTSPYYVDFLGARPGELLEFFTADGAEAVPSGEVKTVIKTEEEDSIELVDGRMLEFGGIGPPEPIVVIRVRTAMNMAAAAPEEGAVIPEDAEEAVAAAAREHSIMAMLRSVLPTAAVEIIPTAERTYPDSMQREGLFQDLLGDLPAKKQTNPRQIRLLEREVDLAVALKNKSVQRDAAGRIIGSAPYLIASVNDAVAHGTVPSAVPVVEGAHVLNLDNADTTGYTYKETDIMPRTLKAVENDSEALATRYLEGAQADAVGGVNSFYGYTYDLLGRDLATLQGPVEGAGWTEDQDVFRTGSLNVKVEGLSRGLPPAPKDKYSIPVTLAFKINDVTNRAIRVLSAERRTYLKTGAVYVSAPSDPNHVTSYVILPPKAALTLRPPRRPGHLPTALLYSAALESDNLPTVAQTLRDLYTLEAGSPLNAWTLNADAAATLSIAEWLQSVLRYTVHPVDSLGPRGPQLLSLLDTLGVGVTDLAPAVAAIIDEWVSDAQDTWVSLMKARRTEIQASLDAEEPRTFQSVVGADSPLWAALRGAEPLKDLLADIGRRNPTIIGAPTLMTASLLVEAQGDATPLVWSEIAKLDSRELAAIDSVSAADALAASRAYTLRRAAIRGRDLLALHAAPEVNTCPHAKRLESIRNVRDVPEHARLLRAFIEEFQGPKSGDWITCVLCKKECVCYHELMELEALAQPQRLDAIQKQILIKFGGDRYEGKIVCKNCGQGLQDIDYDEHVEFDDNGKPIQQASVLTDEQMDEGATTSSWKKAVANLVPDVTFESQSHREIAEGLTDLLTHGRLTMPADVFRRIVTYTDIYTGRRQPDETKYTELLAKKSKMATTKFKKTTGMEGVTIDLPTFAETVDQLRISALIALVTIAIQSQEVTVSTPLPMCSFSRGGYPFEPKAPPTEKGALLYVSCAAADIKLKKKPWLSMSWVGDTKFETRQKKALQLAYAAINTILGVDPGSAALPFTSQVRMELTKVQTDVVAAKERALVSIKDELPTGFRPEPRPPAVRAPATERDPLPAVEAAVLSGSVSTKMANEVGEAVRSQAIAMILALNDATKDTKKKQGEGMCCPTEIATLETAAITQKPLAIAAQLLRRANPTTANAGTHLWPVLETPHAEPIEQDVDDGVLFKLFLKFCYQGHAVGNPHEFSVGNICRQCDLVLGKPVDLIDFGKEGAAILASQQGSLRIEVTRKAFDALSDAARRRKLMKPVPPIAVADKTGLPALIALLATKPETATLGTIMGTILAAPVDADELARAEVWSPLSAHAGGILRATNIDRTMLEVMTEDPFIEGPRALQEYWCAKVQAAAAGFGVTKVSGARWFDISTKHNDIINGILADNANWPGYNASDSMKPILRKIAHTLGPLLGLWITAVRPDPLRWSIAEAQLLLRSIVIQVWGDALTATSWMYADIGASAERAAIVENIRTWTVALMDYKKGPKDEGHKRGHVQTQFVKYSKEAIKRILQQRSELERTSVVEEFESIKDDDLKAAELIKKQFRIGRWGVGKNLQKYDADLFEFENEQRHRMGVVEGPVEADVPQAPPAQGQAQGQVQAPIFVQPEDGYEVNQGADGDDY